MGRQNPGKWIRNLLLGKKSSSKSKSAREKDIYKSSSNKDVLVVSSEAPMSTPTGVNGIKGVVSEKEVVSISSNGGVILSTEEQHDNAQSVANFGSGDHDEKIRLIEAVIVVQAAIRGYQARGKFKTVKGIIPLQAYIRGQLIRQQAIATLYCVKSIVKFQALARGYKVRHSDIGQAVQNVFKDTKFPNSIGVATSTREAKLLDNIFVHKLLASSPSVVSARLKYNSGEEPNLAWEWLDRWTKSHFWGPLQEAKKPDSMSDKKNESSQTVETNKGQVKRNARKAPPVRVGDDPVLDSNKPKGYPKMDSNLPLHSAKGHSQKEHEKRSSRKTQIQNVSDKSEVATKKKAHITRKVSDHTVSDVPKEDAIASSEKMKDLAVSKSKQSDLEKSLGQQAEEHENESCNDTNNPLHSSLMIGNDEGIIEDLNVGEDCISNVNSKNFQRRASLPANFTDNENLSHNNTPKVPSYMAPTESTKARLRGQCYPRSTSDLIDVNSITRRLSLSSSFNSKFGSFSPRADRLTSLSSRVIRNDRSLSSSRDGTDKVIQPRWRR